MLRKKVAVLWKKICFLDFNGFYICFYKTKGVRAITTQTAN